MTSIYILKTLNNAHHHLSSLSTEVQKKILDYKDFKKQEQMISAEILLKYAFNQLGYDDIVVSYTPKPIIEDKNLFISKAHRKDYVVVAVSNENIGIDVEEAKDSVAATKVLSKDEYKIYETGDKGRVFSYYWSVKEAYVKYVGLLSYPYKEINVTQDKTIDCINEGSVLECFYYHIFYKGYSVALVKKSNKRPKIIEVTKEAVLK